MGPVGRYLIVAPLAALSIQGARAGDDIRNNPPGPAQAVAAGRLTLELRPRYNRIEETDKAKTTEGGTVRAIVGWRTAPWEWLGPGLGLRLTLEAIHADHIGTKRFNDDPAQISSSPYPLLPDPRYGGLNQAHVELTAAEGLRLKLGRQLLRMDNQRWVSDNDFRQVPQLFDGAAATYQGLANTELMAGHFTRVRTTSGVSSDLRLTLLHAAWNPAPGHALAAYGYFHDQAQNGAFTGFADNSYRVLGARAEGVATRLGEIEIPYTAELAWQRPYSGGDARIDARYGRLGAGASTGAWLVRYDYEVKGSNRGAYGLQMPLTDFYGFNGWTLHFFNTPREGLRDQWLTGRHAFGPVTLYAEAHRFRSDYGRLDFGREADVGITYEVLPNALLRLQHARYDAGSGAVSPDVRKTWLTLSYAY